ncbi:MAG TPA: polyphosphate polymerase domain-containing protein [Planctomycetota bacterium]|nr:polyphosphate polymerase domain-containing protein [Planctomycetota bacterium]
MATEARTPLHFSRFEFKYVLNRRRREEVEAALQHFVELDPYVANRPQHNYFVRSLYFDNEAHSAFHDKMDGLLTRSKFRIRTYGHGLDDPAPWFLEIKGRHNNLVFKHRTPLAGQFDKRTSGYELSQVVLRHATPGTVLEKFEFELYRRQIRPMVLVHYLRRPYLSKFDPAFRLTFDSQLSAVASDAMFSDTAAMPFPMLRGYTVMEVKFRRHVPAWFHRILQAFDLRRESVSKICAGMQALDLCTEPD